MLLSTRQVLPLCTLLLLALFAAVQGGVTIRAGPLSTDAEVPSGTLVGQGIKLYVTADATGWYIFDAYDLTSSTTTCPATISNSLAVRINAGEKAAVPIANSSQPRRRLCFSNGVGAMVPVTPGYNVDVFVPPIGIGAVSVDGFDLINSVSYNVFPAGAIARTQIGFVKPAQVSCTGNHTLAEVPFSIPLPLRAYDTRLCFAPLLGPWIDFNPPVTLLVIGTTAVTKIRTGPYITDPELPSGTRVAAGTQLYVTARETGMYNFRAYNPLMPPCASYYTDSLAVRIYAGETAAIPFGSSDQPSQLCFSSVGTVPAIPGHYLQLFLPPMPSLPNPLYFTSNFRLPAQFQDLYNSRADMLAWTGAKLYIREGALKSFPGACTGNHTVAEVPLTTSFPVRANDTRLCFAPLRGQWIDFSPPIALQVITLPNLTLTKGGVPVSSLSAGTKFNVTAVGSTGRVYYKIMTFSSSCYGVHSDTDLNQISTAVDMTFEMQMPATITTTSSSSTSGTSLALCMAVRKGAWTNPVIIPVASATSQPIGGQQPIGGGGQTGPGGQTVPSPSPSPIPNTAPNFSPPTSIELLATISGRSLTFRSGSVIPYGVQVQVNAAADSTSFNFVGIYVKFQAGQECTGTASSADVRAITNWFSVTVPSDDSEVGQMVLCWAPGLGYTYAKFDNNFWFQLLPSGYY